MSVFGAPASSRPVRRHLAGFVPGAGAGRRRSGRQDGGVPKLPLDVHAISIPARTFTGDFWFTHRASDRLWFAVGDVSGKGLPAALVMAMIQEELEEDAGCDPAVTMARLDAFLRPLLPGNRFATAVIGCLCDDGTLQIVNAGHCPPLIVRASGAFEEVGSTGPVVGILPHARWQSATMTLDPGDALLLYTDGVIEATSPAGKELGIRGIERALTGTSARAMAESIVRAVERHGGREDDLTVVAITVS